MNNRELAIVLIEKLADANLNKKVRVYIDRLMLRLHSQPALMANLDDVIAFKPGIEAETADTVKDGVFHEGLEDDKPEDQDRASEEDDATVILQLSFKRLPQEVISPLLRLIAAPREPKLFRYIKGGEARLGIQIDLKPSDFPGSDYEYAF